MRRLSSFLILALAAIMCPVTPSFARVGPRDARATRDYLEARIALDRETGAEHGTTDLKAITALEGRVKAECPGVLVGSPLRGKGEKTKSESEVTSELLTAVFGAAGNAEHPEDERFARIVRHLRWSNPKLTRLLRSLALESAEQSGIAPPDLCADLKFWVASDYTTVSAGTKRYLHRLRVVSSITLIEPEPNEPVGDLFDLTALVARRLKPYEDQVDRVLAKKALPPEAKLTDPAMKPLLEAMGGVFAALENPPAPASSSPSS